MYFTSQFPSARSSWVHFRVRNSTESHPLWRHSCCVRQGHLRLFIEQQRCQAQGPSPSPCSPMVSPRPSGRAPHLEQHLRVDRKH